jgi:hypothetical protein
MGTSWSKLLRLKSARPTRLTTPAPKISNPSIHCGREFRRRQYLHSQPQPTNRITPLFRRKKDIDQLHQEHDN